ncbi:hypothetical protein KSP40_PGU004615 [Platanthera guangdongensis]|uniref:Secreted protein n=1 Tax=Platanthera guangdongensis TaxID=2320717 RepID=A0ABR2LFA3_9ASPA
MISRAAAAVLSGHFPSSPVPCCYFPWLLLSLVIYCCLICPTSASSSKFLEGLRHTVPLRIREGSVVQRFLPPTPAARMLLPFILTITC